MSASVIFFYHFNIPASSIELLKTHFSEQMRLAVDDDNTLNFNSETRILPDDWRHNPVTGTSGWYRIPFQLQQQPTELWTLVIPTVRLNAEVFLNGKRIGDGGSITAPVGHNKRRPLIFNIPPTDLQQDLNQLHIHVLAGANHIGYLDKLYIGPERDLRPAYNKHYFIRITLVKLITSMILLIASMVGMLGLIRRGEQEYGYFTLCALIWVAHSFDYFTVNIPVSDRVWDWFTYTSLGYFAIFCGVFHVHRYLGLHIPAIERPVLITGVSISLIMFFLPDGWFYNFSNYIWHPLCQTAAIYGFVRLMKAAWGRDSWELHIIAVSGMVLTIYALHDLLLVIGLLDWNRGYIIQYAMPLVILLFCILLIQRFVAAINELEQMNASLEYRVEERRIALEKTYAQLQQSEQQRLLVEERDRIMRDMHDGVGGQLVSTLTVIREGQTDLNKVSQMLQAALQDLRLTIDSLDSNMDNLSVLLGMFRDRVEPALQAKNIAVVWQVNALGDSSNFGSVQALQLLRILQEFVTNTLRHSEASEIHFYASEDQVNGARHIVIELADNGKGSRNITPHGRGISNMHYRAKALGSKLVYQSDTDGTRIQLTFSS